MDSLERLALPLVRAHGAHGARRAEAEGGAALASLAAPGVHGAQCVSVAPAGLSAHAASSQVLVSASLATAIGKKPVSGSFCLAGGTMEGIIQCLVFLKAFQVGRLTGSNQRKCYHRADVSRLTGSWTQDLVSYFVYFFSSYFSVYFFNF